MKKTVNTNKANTQNKATFADLLRNYELQVVNKQTHTKDYLQALEDLAKATTYSVLKKCIDTSNNKALIQVKRDIAKDSALLKNTQYAILNSESYGYNENGDYIVSIIDKQLDHDLKTMLNTSLGDGLDLVHDCMLSIIEETNKAKQRNQVLSVGFLEEKYQVTRLKKKVYIKLEDSKNGFETVETTPIQETYKTVRRAINSSKAIQSDARNGYTYLEDLAIDEETQTEERIYRRLPKYADLGGYATDFNGANTLYSADSQTVEDIETLIELLELSKQQLEIVNLRLRGYGYKAIATYMGVRNDNIRNQLKRIQEKAIKIGLNIE